MAVLGGGPIGCMRSRVTGRGGGGGAEGGIGKYTCFIYLPQNPLSIFNQNVADIILSSRECKVVQEIWSP